MKTTIEFDVNVQLQDAFINHLENIAAGEGGEDRKYTLELAAEAKGNPEEWSDELRQEMGSFLLLLAGFQCGAGYHMSEWVAK